MVVFESEDGAQALAGIARDAPAGAVSAGNVEVGEVRLLWSPNRSAVDDLPDTRDQISRDVDSCSAGSNRTRQAPPVAGS